MRKFVYLVMNSIFYVNRLYSPPLEGSKQLLKRPNKPFPAILSPIFQCSGSSNVGLFRLNILGPPEIHLAVPQMKLRTHQSQGKKGLAIQPQKVIKYSKILVTTQIVFIFKSFYFVIQFLSPIIKKLSYSTNLQLYLLACKLIS